MSHLLRRSNASWDFVGAKTAMPIPLTSSLRRDLLVMASLDPSVCRIGFAERPLDLLVFDFVFGRCVILEPAVRLDEIHLAERTATRLGLPTHTFTDEEITADPLAANCRQVWSFRHHRVSASDRIRVLGLLGEESGACSLGRLATEIRSGTDPVAAVLAMLCADLLEADLSAGPLDPETRIRRRNRGDAP